MNRPVPDPVTSALVTRAKNGDQRSFETLYRDTVGAVYGLCLRMTADPSLAEDCVQQTYLQAWRNLARFRGDSSLTTWLHRIAVNEVRGHFRKELKHPDGDNEEEPAARATTSDIGMDLERAIATLPERARAVFVLVGVYGYPHDESATMLNIAVGTSKAHYHHARHQLRALLGEAQ